LLKLLWPFIFVPGFLLSILFRIIIILRKSAYKYGLLKSQSAKIPLIVVGNLRIGGSGKTPVLISLVKHFQANGLKVGVVSRGYGRKTKSALLVDLAARASIVGDEPYLIAEKTGAPVSVAIKRIQAVRLLEESYDLDLILSDDGMQHYALQRDLEICLTERKEQISNKYLLPLGPFREPWSRLKTVDLVWKLQESVIFETDNSFKQVKNSFCNLDLKNLANKSVHAVCGIARPERFLDSLKALGLKVIPHVFADHYSFTETDFNFTKKNLEIPVIMTEKDAVKCRSFAGDNWWSLAIEAKISAKALQDLDSRLNLLFLKVKKREDI
jgi:tetraacyldisaccharide 4'-kinase